MDKMVSITEAPRPNIGQRIDQGLARMKERWANLRNTPPVIARPSNEDIGPVVAHAQEKIQMDAQAEAKAEAKQREEMHLKDARIDLMDVSTAFRQALNSGETIIPARMSEADMAKYPDVNGARRDHVFDHATNVKVVEWMNGNELKAGYAVTRMKEDKTSELVVYTLDESGHFKLNTTDWLLPLGQYHHEESKATVAPTLEEWKAARNGEPASILKVDGSVGGGTTGEADPTKVYRWPTAPANEEDKDKTKILHRDVAAGFDGDSFDGMPPVEADVTQPKKKDPSEAMEVPDSSAKLAARLAEGYVTDPYHVNVTQQTAEIAEDRASQKTDEEKRAAAAAEAAAKKADATRRRVATRKDNEQLKAISAEQAEHDKTMDRQAENEALLAEAEKIVERKQDEARAFGAGVADESGEEAEGMEQVRKEIQDAAEKKRTVQAAVDAANLSNHEKVQEFRS